MSFDVSFINEGNCSQPENKLITKLAVHTSKPILVYTERTKSKEK